MTTTTTATSGTTYILDTAHTTAEFIVRHMMIAKVRGRFVSFEGTMLVPEGSDVPSSIDVSIDTASIDTRDEQRDAHLKSADFFDAATYPKITFRSTHIEAGDDGFRVHGALGIHGVTRDVVLDATFEGRGADPWGNQRIGYEAHGKINRKDFGLTWNQGLETGGVLVGDEVKIEINAEAIAAK